MSKPVILISKRFNSCLFARCDAIDHRRTNTARTKLFDRFNRRVEVTAVTQVHLNFISIAKNELFGKTCTGLDKVQSRTKFIDGDWCSR